MTRARIGTLLSQCGRLWLEKTKSERDLVSLLAKTKSTQTKSSMVGPFHRQDLSWIKVHVLKYRLMIFAVDFFVQLLQNDIFLRMEELRRH